jgi:hypothetical protein
MQLNNFGENALCIQGYYVSTMLTYKTMIVMCYGCQIKALANNIHLAQTWAIIETICDVLSPVVTTCVVN